KSYPTTHVTDTWAGTAPQTNYTFAPNLKSLPSGDYRLVAILEKSNGYMQVVDATDAEHHAVWQYLSADTTAAAFAHVNPLQPAAPVTNLLAAGENGQIKVSWTAPSNMTNVMGYQVNVTPAGTDSILLRQTVSDPAATAVFFEAANSWDGTQVNGANVLPTIIYGESYRFTVTPIRIDTLSAEPEIITVCEGLPVTSNAASVSEPQRPSIHNLWRMAGDSNDGTDLRGEKPVLSPTDMIGLTAYLRSIDKLLVGSPVNVTAFEWKVSERIEDATDINALTYTDLSAYATQSGNQLDILFINGTDTLAEGSYRVELTLKNGADYNVFRFDLLIDNTPPVLLVSEKMQNGDGDWVISGATEPGANLLFNGANIDAKLNAGAFTLTVDENLSHISVQATDAAGNISTVSALLNGIAQLGAGDLTEAVEIDFENLQLKMSNTSFTATAQLKRSGAPVAPTPGEITWSVLKGGAALSINAATGVLTPKAAGEATIRATYGGGALTDDANITVAEEFPVGDLRVSQVVNETAVTLNFTEPTGATGKSLELSMDAPQEGVVVSGWTSVSATFDGAGNAALTIPNADSTFYFRLIVTGGLNEGTSNTAGKMGRQAMATSVYTVTVTPATASLMCGDTQQFTADVTATGSASTAVTWTVAGNLAGSAINSTGLLTVSADETAASLTVTATSVANPAVSGSATVTVIANPETGIEDVDVAVDANAVTLHPNPANDIVTIDGAAEGSTVAVYNASGALVINRKAASSPEKVSVAHLPDGVYIVRITDGQKVKTMKLVISRQ
ncbi:MAG: T9SS type A sorting domain-containing protein, partial [Bacteroidales bacterium]|nr:T9SS type A sorting domain-containing protein [Bacteroidales bacterium]